jgi:hypothetical protein
MIEPFGFHENKILLGIERSLPMPESRDMLTTQEFANQSGVSAGTVSKWLRNGTIIGEKKNGKWFINAAELVKAAQLGRKSTAHSMPGTSASEPQPPTNDNSAASFSIQEFTDMTYLTEVGVRKWLKEGRLVKASDEHGNIRVDGSNLAKPHVKRLLR